MCRLISVMVVIVPSYLIRIYTYIEGTNYGKNTLSKKGINCQKVEKLASQCVFTL